MRTDYVHICKDGKIRTYPSVVCSCCLPSDKSENIKIADFLKYLYDRYVGYKNEQLVIDKRKPTHGPCCTCQTCGYDYDLCRCLENDISIACAIIKTVIREDT